MLVSDAIKLMSGGNGGSEYGIEWHSDTDTYYRLGSANGKTAITGGQNDFDNLEPWKSLKRCVLSDNGTVNYYLDANDSTKKTDGTTADLTGASGQVMVEIPKFYYKCVYPDANTFQFWISDKPRAGYEEHPAFYRDRNGDGSAEEVDKRYFGAFEGYYNATTGKLESRSGVSPKVSTTIANFRTYAQNRGSGWGIQDYNLTYAVQMLYLVEYGHFDSQTKIGKGVTSGTAIVTTGRTLTLGNKSGNESNVGTDGLHAMSYRGIENLFGNVAIYVDGLVFYNWNALINDKSFNDTGSNYTQISTGITANLNGYISKTIQNNKLSFIPIQSIGSSTTKLNDYAVLMSGTVLPRFGGYYSENTYGGLFYWDIKYASTNYATFAGSRLTY